MSDPDGRLLKNAKNGNDRAFAKLVEKYQRDVLFLIYDLIGNYEDARDVAQEVFLRVHQRLDQFEERARFSTWLYRIAVNSSIDFTRKRDRNTTEYLEEKPTAESKTVPDYLLSKGSPQLVLEQAELKQQIETAVQKLSMNQRTAIVLKYFHHKQTSEIARIMACQENTVRIHLFRGVNKLRELLSHLN